MVIMDMENGDQVTKRGYFCPQDSMGGGGNYPQDSRGVGNPNNPLIYATAITSVPLKTNISYEYFENFRFFFFKTNITPGIVSALV